MQGQNAVKSAIVPEGSDIMAGKTNCESCAYYVYDGFADMIRKGKDVELKKGEVLNVILVDPVDVPVI